MAKVSLRGASLGLLAIGLFLGLNLTAAAQNPPKGKTEENPGIVNLEEPTNLINKYTAEAWQANKLTPADKCSDYEFIRRASLDIIGRIAKLDEIDRFMKDPASVRRQMLVDRLLASPEYAENWSTIWTHWLMTRTGDRLYRDQIKLWLAEQFETEDLSVKKMAEELIAAKGKSNENGAVNYILAHLGGENNQQVYDKEGQFDMVPITARTIRLFLGYQIQCTQCHDHPFNADWKQKHFWGVNAFFRQTQRIGNPQMQQQPNMPRAQLTLGDNPGFNKSGIIFFEKRNGVFLPSEAIFLDGTRFPKGSLQQVNRREELAKFITSNKNFSRAYINRMWGHLFGRGLNNKPAFDDFGEHNEIVHEEMLNQLGDAFAKAGYNPRKLIRWITASEAYQLRAVANKSNDQPEAEAYMSRQMLKAMSPEQLLESLIVATRPAASKDEKELEKFRADWMSRLVVNFGDDEGNEGTFNGTVVQALLMMNGRDINAAISRESGTVQKASQFKKPRDTMDYLFLATLNRKATDKEFSQIMSRLPLANGRIKESEPAGPLQDLFWALLNCNEFFLNH